MLLPIALTLLAFVGNDATAAATRSTTAEVSAQPNVLVQVAGYVHDARGTIDEAGKLRFGARIDAPLTRDRAMFTLELLDANGRVIAVRDVHACVEAGSARHARARRARIDVKLADVFGTTTTGATIRIRSAE